MPTSTTATSTGVSAKIEYASAVTISKNDSGTSKLAVDQLDVGRELAVGLDEVAVADRLRRR